MPRQRAVILEHMDVLHTCAALLIEKEKIGQEQSLKALRLVKMHKSENDTKFVKFMHTYLELDAIISIVKPPNTLYSFCYTP